MELDCPESGLYSFLGDYTMRTWKKGFFVTLTALVLVSIICAAEETKPTAPAAAPPTAVKKNKPAAPAATSPTAVKKNKPVAPPAQPTNPQQSSAPAAPAQSTTPAQPATSAQPAAQQQPAAPAQTAPPVTPAAPPATPAATPAAQPAAAEVKPAEQPATMQFPYAAEIVGTEVYVRSGPGTAYYHCAKLSAPQRVTVVASTHGNWFQILPPPGSFSWISKTYINVNPAQPKIGVLTGDAVRVWAGSDFVEPMRSSSLQTKLNQGATVEIVGSPEGEGDYYKITPPAGAYLWVSGECLKPLKKEEPKPEAKEGQPKLEDVTRQAKTGEGEVKKEETKPAPPPRPKMEQTYMKQCYDISAKLDEEVKKSAPQQKYDPYKKMLEPILADPNNAGMAVQYAQYLSDRIGRYELAINAGDQLKQQEQKMTDIRKQIDEARKTQLEKISRQYEQYIMTGILKPSYVYSGKAGQKRYLLTNEQGRVIAYVVLSDASLASQAENLFNKKIGLVGRVVNSPKELVTLVTASKIEELKE